jgi:uncharacterized membrane protein (Fun14 family)
LVLIPDNFISISGTIGGGFVAGILIGWAVKKVIKLVAIMAGLFLAGLAYLQYQRIASVNWNRIEGTISTITHATTNTFNDHNIESLATTNLGIPLTGGMSAGFANWLYEGLIKNGYRQCSYKKLQNYSKFF